MAGNTVEILSSINKTVSFIATTLSQGNKSAAAVSSLSKGDVGVKPSPTGGSTIGGLLGNTQNMGELLKTMASLPGAIVSISKLSGGTMKKFDRVIDSLVKSVKKITDYTQKNKDAVKDVSEFSKAIDALAVGTKKFASMALLGPVALVGATMTIPVIGVTLLIFKMIQAAKIDKETTRSIKDFMSGINLMVSAMYKAAGLIAICIGLGLLIKLGGKEILLNGLIVLGSVIGAMMLIIAITGLAGYLLKEVGALNALKDIMIFTFATLALVAICVGLGFVVTDPKVKNAMVNGLIVLAGVLVVMIVLIGIAWIASTLIKNVGGVKVLVPLIVFAFGTMGFIFVARYLGDMVKEHYDSILWGVGATMAVMLALIGIAALASMLKQTALKGVMALAAVELVAFGATLILGGVMLLANRAKEIGWDNIIYTLLSMGGVILEFGILAGVASFVLPEILLGSIAIAAIELLAIGATHMMGKIMDMIKVKEDYGFDWGTIFLAVTSMGGLMAEFGVMAGLMSLLLIPIALATPAVLMVASFAWKMINIIKAVSDLTNSINEAGGFDVVKKTVTEHMPQIIGAFKKENFDLPLSVWDMMQIGTRLSMFSTLTGSLVKATVGIAKIARVAGVITDKGELRPFYGLNDKGEPIYGQPVDMEKTAKLICDVISTFVTELNFGFEDVYSMFNTSIITALLGKMVEPISKFVDMLTMYKAGAETDTLIKIKFNPDGSINEKGSIPINVKEVAHTIADVVSAFVSELYSDENAAVWAKGVDTYYDYDHWYSLMPSLKSKPSATSMALMNTAGILGALVDPFVKFIDLLTSFKPGADGKLKKITVGSDGKIIESGDIDVKGTAQSIVGAINTLMTILFDPNTMKSWITQSSLLSSGFSNIISEYLNNYIGVAEKLSSDNIITERVLANTSAIVSTINDMCRSDLMTLDPAVINTRTIALKNLINVMSSIMSPKFSENADFLQVYFKSTGTKEIDTMTTSLSKNTSKLIDFKNTFKAVDDVIIKESNRREEAIKKTTTAMKKLLDKISNAKNDVAELKSLLDKLETMDTSKINSNVNNIETGRGGRSGGSSGGGGGLFGTKIDYDKMKKAVQQAIYDALSASTLKQNGDFSNISSSRDDIVKLIADIVNSTYKFENIQTPK